MQRKSQLDLTDHRIWKDKNINPEYKRLYTYLYQKGLDKNISFHINIGEVQQTSHITNVGFRKCLKILKEFKYIKHYIEYDTGLYEIKVY